MVSLYKQRIGISFVKIELGAEMQTNRQTDRLIDEWLDWLTIPRYLPSPDLIIGSFLIPNLE